ncbi:MAG: F0F1 ATP synthase subunit delta [Candidatus Pacebacteria bacterium]|nr:F0F1 ATP synthase subunit delta [Candidatus Paceibacterota bacterium]
MNVTDYSKAALLMLNEDTSFDAVLTKLTALLKKRGHERLLRNILTQLVTDIEQQNATAVATVSIRTDTDTLKYKTQIEDALKTLGAEGEYRTHIDDTLIGGYQVTAHQKTINNTFKRTLINLYRAATR